jgi:hypothetical protein
MQVAFQKNVFFSNEIANAMVTVDNTKSKLRVNEIEFQVTQHLKISNGHRTHHHKKDILENKDLSGIPPG